MLRGRPGQPQPVQAAEIHVRRLDGLTALDALSVVGSEEAAPGGWMGELAGPTCGYRVCVQARSGPPRPLSCGDEAPETPPVWRPVTVDREPLERA